MVNYRTLKTEELEDWFDLCGSVFEESPQYFKNHFFHDPWRNINGIFVAEDHNKLIATVRVFHREIHCGKETLTLGGIGEVCTRSEYQKQGISTKLLNMAIRYMKDKGYDLSSLETGTHKHYAKLGWKTVAQSFTTSNVEASDQFNHIIKPINFVEQQDLSDLLTLYTNYCSNKIGPIVRNGDYFKTWIKHEASKNTDSWLIYNDTKDPLAYIIYNVEKDSLHIKEFCALNGHEEIINTLIPYLIHKIGNKGLSVIYPSQIKTNFKIVKEQSYEGYMLKIMDKLNKDLVADLEANLLFWNLDSF